MAWWGTEPAEADLCSAPPTERRRPGGGCHERRYGLTSHLAASPPGCTGPAPHHLGAFTLEHFLVSGLGRASGTGASCLFIQTSLMGNGHTAIPASMVPIPRAQPVETAQGTWACCPMASLLGAVAQVLWGNSQHVPSLLSVSPPLPSCLLDLPLGPSAFPCAAPSLTDPC